MRMLKQKEEVSNGERETGRGAGKFHTSEFLTRFGRLGCLSTVQRFKLAMQFVLNYLQHCCKTRKGERETQNETGDAAEAGLIIKCTRT